MANIDFDIKQFLPEEFRDSDFVKDMADTFQKVVVDPVMSNVNTLLRAHEPTRDVKGISLRLSKPDLSIKIPDIFKRESVSISLQGIILLREDPATYTDDIGTVIDVVTGDVYGTIEPSTRKLILNIPAATPSNTVDLELQYETVYELDFEALSRLRRSLGLFIDTTGLQDENATRRMIADLPHFYTTGHSEKFVEYLSFVSGVQFRLERLYSRLNEYPNYGLKRSNDEVALDGFTAWVHESAIPEDPNDWSTVADDIWYPTSYIRLEYDDETFFSGADLHIDLFQKITKLFYQMAPIQLVLETIVARRKREHKFRMINGFKTVAITYIATDPSTVTGITPS